MQLLKQSTAATTIVGPIMDSTGAAYTGAVIGDLNITKNGTTAAMAAAATLTHDHNGHYLLLFTTGNTDTAGRLDITCNKSTYAMPPKQFEVLIAAAFDVVVTNGTIASTTNITAGTITTVTTVTNQLTAAAIATGVWTDTTAGDFTTALSIGKSVMNGVSLGTGLTIAAVSGAVGSVTGAVGSVTGAVGSVTGNVGGSVASVTAAVSVTGDLSATMKTSVQTAADAAITANATIIEIETETDAIQAQTDKLTFDGHSPPNVTAILYPNDGTVTNITAIYNATVALNYSGSVTSGGSTTGFIDSALAYAADQQVNGRDVLFTSGTLSGEMARISAYNHTTKAITLESALTSIPANGVTYLILAQGGVLQ